MAVVVADVQDAEMERRLGVVVVADAQVAAVAVAPGVAVVAIYVSVVMGASMKNNLITVCVMLKFMLMM